MTPDRERDAAVRELVHSLVEHAPPAPPFPQRDARGRATRGPRAAAAAFVVLALVVGAVVLVAQHTSRDTRPTSTTHTTAAPAPVRGLGRIAYVSRTGLVVVDSPGHERVLLKGNVSTPAWSYDGKWLAFQRNGLVQGELTQQDLWVVAASGGAPRKLLANVVQWSWSRANPSALVATDYGSGAVVLLANGSWRWKVPLAGVTGAAWANHTTTLAVATGGPNGPRLYLADMFDPRGRCLAPCPSKPVLVRYRLANSPTFSTLLLDRFTTDDRAVLGWVDEMGSASATLDGIPLVAIPTAGGSATRFPTMLVKPAWVRDAPTGTDVLVVASSGRIVSDQRQLRRCDSAGQCVVPLVAGVQTMDPAWSPDGSHIAYVRSDASHAFPPLVGPQHIPDWATRYEKRHLWIADADGTHAHEIRVTPVNDGVAVLEWSDTNHVIGVIDGALRSVDVATGRSRALTGLLYQPGATLPSEAVYETGWESLVAIQPGPAT